MTNKTNKTNKKQIYKNFSLNRNSFYDVLLELKFLVKDVESGKKDVFEASNVMTYIEKQILNMPKSDRRNYLNKIRNLYHEISRKKDFQSYDHLKEKVAELRMEALLS